MQIALMRCAIQGDGRGHHALRMSVVVVVGLLFSKGELFGVVCALLVIFRGNQSFFSPSFVPITHF